MRLELIRVGLLVELANHYTTKGASYPSAEKQSVFSNALADWTTRYNMPFSMVPVDID